MPLMAKASDGTSHFLKRFHLFKRKISDVAYLGLEVEHVEDLKTGKKYIDLDSHNKHLECVRAEVNSWIGKSHDVEVKLTEIVSNHEKLENGFRDLKSLHNVTEAEKNRLQGALVASETRVEEQKEDISRLADEFQKKLVQAREWFEGLLAKKDEELAALRTAINALGETSRQERLEVEESHEKAVEGLRKQLELLDQDFVDVAKAMRVFRQNEDRPKKGFRIKL